jgi:hypothetical protein
MKLKYWTLDYERFEIFTAVFICPYSEMTSYRQQCLRTDVLDKLTGCSGSVQSRLHLKVGTYVRIYIVSCRTRWKIFSYLNASR